MFSLIVLVYKGREEAVRDLIAEIVPTFHAPDTSQWIPPELLVGSTETSNQDKIEV